MPRIWQSKATPGTRAEFVFLSVDVIGHSKLYANQPSNSRLASIHNVLTKLRNYTIESIPQYKRYLLWDWASDGGILGFPSSRIDSNTTADVLDCAITIWRNLPDFNAQHVQLNLEKPIALHISLDRGDAYYAAKRSMRRSDALNVAAKLKSPSGQTEILVTERIHNDLPPAQRERFIEVFQTPEQKRIYGYLPAMQRAMTELAEDASANNRMEAAQCYYRLGRFHLAEGHGTDAERAFASAVAALDGAPVEIRHRYFFRTLYAFYHSWLCLLREASFDVASVYRRQGTFLHSPEVIRLFKEDPQWGWRGNLISQLELIFKQMDILCEKVVNAPAGLSTLESTVVLQRMGYSPRYFGDALGKRLDRVEREIAENNYRSIDGDCSLCTGAAVSALVLGGRLQRAEVLYDWLRLLKPFRFCILRRDYTDAAPREHGLHYAANVLQGFLDYSRAPRPESEAVMREVIKEFFRSDKKDSQGFFADWMRYRNIDAFEVCTYILPVFLRYILAGYIVSESEKRRLKKAVATLSANILREVSACETEETPGRFYAARENVGSFSLGLLLGMDKQTERIADHVLSLFNVRAHSQYFARSSLTLDSNLDRTRRFLEGWLLQWETALYIREHDQQNRRTVRIPDYVRRLLNEYAGLEPEG